jgi:transposase
MEALSLDLRERICVACDEHFETRAEVAERFGVSRSFVQKLLRRHNAGESIAAKPKRGGRKPVLSDSDRRLLSRAVALKGDATLAELCQSLTKAGGASVSKPTMCRVLKTMRLPLKKRRCTPRSGTRRVCGRYAATGRNASERWTRRSWSSWTKAASTPQ